LLVGDIAGEGNFSVVFNARHCTRGTIVAYKDIQLKQACLSPKKMEALMTQLRATLDLSHKNINRNFGF
jgi:hypothetical protein